MNLFYSGAWLKSTRNKTLTGISAGGWSADVAQSPGFWTEDSANASPWSYSNTSSGKDERLTYFVTPVSGIFDTYPNLVMRFWVDDAEFGYQEFVFDRNTVYPCTMQYYLSADQGGVRQIQISGLDSSSCDSIQATHYQIRWEFDRIVTLDSDGNSGNYHLSQIFPIPAGGVDDVVHRFAGFLAPYVASRIRFCDANGAIKPYRGSGYIAHVLNADGSGTLMGSSSFSASSPDVLYTAVTPLTQALADGAGTTSVNTLVSFSESDEVLSDDCETIEPPGDDDDEVELPEGEDPPDGQDPPAKKDGEKGKRKDDPDTVETCECYDIINQRLTDINNNIAILNDNMLEQMQVHNDTFAVLITKMQEWTRYLSGQWREIMFEKNKFDDLRQKRLKQFFTSGSGEKIADSVQRATDALYVSDSDSAHDGDSIADLHNSVLHSTLNEDMSITDVIENIEPVHIENEYRTQSHRVIDNFDSTQNL